MPGGPRRLLGNRRTVREFIYSGDAAEAVVRLLKSGYTEPLNIGTGVGTSIKELAEMVARLTGFRGEIYGDTSKADGVHRKVLDVSRMESVLGWKPPTSSRPVSPGRSVGISRISPPPTLALDRPLRSGLVA